MSDQHHGKAYRVMEIPVAVDLSPLSFFLYRQGIPHKVTEESGTQVVWTLDPLLVVQIEQYYNDWQSGLLHLQEPPQRKKAKVSTLFRKIAWRQYPVTLLFLIVSIGVAIVTGFGQAWDLVADLTFVPFQMVEHASGDATLYFGTLSMVLDHGQYWRLITPVFLHFSALHLIFNMLWLFDLGKRIEARQGGMHLCLLIIVTGLSSNVIQYIWGGSAAIFGGFSGVVFGLLGYCLLREKLDKSCQFGILPAIYGFMLIYLVIGYTGVLDGLVGGSVANAAHTGGLLSGALAGILAGVLLRNSKKEHEC